MSENVLEMERPGGGAKRPKIRMTATRRAAIIIAMLNEETASKVMQQLDDDSLEKVTAELDHVPYLAKTELLEVIIDFVSHLRETSGTFIGGREVARDLVSQLVRARDIERADQTNALPTLPLDFMEEEEDPANNVWNRLEQRDSAQIGEYLSRLTPNLVSMIVRKLSAVKCSEVINQFEEDLLREVMGYLIQPDKDDADLDAVVGRLVEMEFLNTSQGASDENAEHLESIGEILSLVPSDRREALVSFLKEEHEETLLHIEKAMFTIEAVPDILPRTAVPVVFREMDMDQTIRLIGALQSDKPDVAEFFLSNISARMADLIRDELKVADPMSDVETEAAQRQFIGTLMELRRSGKVEIVAKEE